MRYRFRSRRLEALYTEEKGAHRYDPSIIDAFFDVMAVIAAAADERDLYNLKGFHFEKLAGDRQGQHSLRLNRQWRLIVVIEEDQAGRYLRIDEIVDYH